VKCRGCEADHLPPSCKVKYVCGAINPQHAFITCMGTAFPLLVHGQRNPIVCPQMSVHFQKKSLFNFQIGFKK